MELFRYQNPILSEQGHQRLLARRDFFVFPALFGENYGE